MSAQMGRLFVDVVGAGAALCSIASFVPQFLKIWRDKASRDVSLRMYVLTIGAFSLWIVYGVMRASWPLVAANAVSFGLASAILVLQLRYRARGRRAAASLRGRRGPARTSS